MGTVTKVIGSAKGFYDVARYLKKDRAGGDDRDTGFRMGYNVSPDLMEAAREMDQAAAGRLMHEPCLHMVLSPAPGEDGRLGPAELDHMVGDLVRELGWQDYQVLVVEHLDTDHQHVHLMVNRAHPLESGESIGGYYLYNDLRRWAQDFDARRERAEKQYRPDEVDGVEEAQVGYALDFEERPQPSAPPGLDPAPKAVPDLVGGPQPPAYETMPGAEGPHDLTNLAVMAEKAGLDREVWTITELERLAHEKEISVAMLRADMRQRQTTGRALLSGDERRVLRQTAQEIGAILERQQVLTKEERGRFQTAQPARLGEPAPPADGRAGPAPDPAGAIERSYRDLLAAARPYWMHPEAAVRGMKDLAALQGHTAVIWAIRHEPDGVGVSTTDLMTQADADRLVAAYHRYETHRRQYVAEALDRLGLPAEERARAQLDAALPASAKRSKDAALPAGPEPDQSLVAVKRAEGLYIRDVASRILEQRIQAVQSQLGLAQTHAQRLGEAVRERAFHHLHSALRDIYRDPAAAFHRLEDYHGRSQIALILERPDLLGATNPTRVRARVRGQTPRRRVADLIRRYDRYVAGPEVDESLSSARERMERLQRQIKMLGAIQQRIGTPEATGTAFEALERGLTPGARHRLNLRLAHLPGSEVRRRTEQLLQGTLRMYTGRVQPGQIRGLAAQQATERAMRRAAGDVARKTALKNPLRFTMRAAGWGAGVGTSKLTVPLHVARTFFER